MQQRNVGKRRYMVWGPPTLTAAVVPPAMPSVRSRSFGWVSVILIMLLLAGMMGAQQQNRPEATLLCQGVNPTLIAPYTLPMSSSDPWLVIYVWADVPINYVIIGAPGYPQPGGAYACGGIIDVAFQAPGFNILLEGQLHLFQSWTQWADVIVIPLHVGQPLDITIQAAVASTAEQCEFGLSAATHVIH